MGLSPNNPATLAWAEAADGGDTMPITSAEVKTNVAIRYASVWPAAGFKSTSEPT